MKLRPITVLAAALAGLIATSAPLLAQGTGRFAAIWVGTLDAGGTKLRIVFNVSTATDGSLGATMDSPDQGAKGIPVTTVTAHGDSLQIEMKNIAGVYDGKMEPGDSVLTGMWSQGGMSFPLVLKKSVTVPELPRRPQDPNKPYPYNEEDVEYKNTEAAITLAGTLTTPRKGGPFPAVLLITGSGTQDRNEQIFNHRPFLVLADYLTRRGIAVLRVDDRGIGGSTGSPVTATTRDFAGDALAGVQYLKSRKEVNPAKIGLIGHSEGGIIAPMVAAESRDIAFIVLMAGTALPGKVIINRQLVAIGRARGESEASTAKFLRLNERLLDLAAVEPDSAALMKSANALLDSVLGTLTGQEKDQFEPTLKQSKMQLRNLVAPWTRFFLTYDPRPTLSRVTCPVLAINGENDRQVLPDENLPLIEKALRSGGNSHVTVKKLPGLNHLFQTSETGSPNEYASIEETFSPKALSLIGEWIQAQVGMGATKQEK
jgi:pimeloyl-ACP methyl ester carboxylesterase